MSESGRIPLVSVTNYVLFEVISLLCILGLIHVIHNTVFISAINQRLPSLIERSTLSRGERHRSVWRKVGAVITSSPTLPAQLSAESEQPLSR